MDLATLRTRHPKITYQAATYLHQDTQLTFSATFLLEPGIIFEPTVKIDGISQEQFNSLDPKALEKYAFLLGLVELPSYWKASCSPVIEISAQLPPAQSNKSDIQNYIIDLLRNGLSEFYFINDIAEFTQPDFVTVTFTEPNSNLQGQNQVAQDNHIPDTTQSVHTQHSPVQKVLLPLGGGKDSLLALKLLQTAGLNQDQLGILVLEPASPAAKILAHQSGLQLITAKRSIDPKLIALNKEGYLNGHTPFSAYLSVLSSYTGFVFGYSHVALANERSANEGNLIFHGLEINHQWSKSFAYEQHFQAISASFLPSTAPFYFSLLRPLYELQIAKLFAQFYYQDQEALSTFRSCNRNQQQNRWCGDCPKCLFASLILAPFFSPDQLVGIFGEDLLNKPSMIPIAHDLLGKGTNKPLECVGMYEESLLAAYLTIQRYYPTVPNSELPVVLAEIQTKILPTEDQLETRATQMLISWNNDNALPPILSGWLKEQLHARST